jgi:transposase-like protein
MGSFTGGHCGRDMSRTCGRWSLAAPLSERQGEERLAARGVSVDHAPIQRWVLQYSPPWKRRATAARARWGAAGGGMPPLSG